MQMSLSSSNAAGYTEDASVYGKQQNPSNAMMYNNRGECDQRSEPPSVSVSALYPMATHRAAGGRVQKPSNYHHLQPSNSRQVLRGGKRSRYSSSIVNDGRGNIKTEAAVESQKLHRVLTETTTATQPSYKEKSNDGTEVEELGSSNGGGVSGLVKLVHGGQIGEQEVVGENSSGDVIEESEQPFDSLNTGKDDDLLHDPEGIGEVEEDGRIVGETTTLSSLTGYSATGPKQQSTVQQQQQQQPINTSSVVVVFSPTPSEQQQIGDNRQQQKQQHQDNEQQQQQRHRLDR